MTVFEFKKAYEFFDASLYANRIGKPVFIRLEAPSGAGKSTLFKQYEGLEGVKIVKGNVTEFAYLTSIIPEMLNNGYTTLVHEDITRIKENDLLKVINIWAQICDREVNNLAFKPRVNYRTNFGFILTHPTSYFQGKVYDYMSTSGFFNRILQPKFDSTRDLRRLLSMAHRNGNIHKRIPDFSAELRNVTQQDEEKVYALNLSGQQKGQILNLIECGCSLETIQELLNGVIFATDGKDNKEKSSRQEA